MDELIFTITDAGRQAVINASNTGTEKVEIKSVGVGSRYYVTSPEQSSIQNEIKRITSVGGAVISPDTIHVSARDNSPDEYVVYTVGLYTDKNVLFAVYSRQTPIVNKSSATVMLISSDITFKSLDTANITFGDVVFINPPASESVIGVSRFANKEEIDAGKDSTLSVSAKRFKDELDKKANLNSPNFTGTPTAPTAGEADNSLKVANTAFIKQVLLAYAKLASPNFTGKPTAPTASQSTNDTQLATTAFVRTAIAALVDSSPGALDTLNELAAALGDDPNFATTMTNALAGKQPLDGTLTNLSGKNVPALIDYLGLRETVNKAASAHQDGSWGLGSNGLILKNTDLLSANGVGNAFFVQGGGTDNHFGSYGAGVHLSYGSGGGNTLRLSANLFVDPNGNLSVEWLEINRSDGSVRTQKLQKLYGPLNKPTARDVGAIPFFGEIATGTNLNTLTDYGIWFNPANANATPELNYPSWKAGSLLILRDAGCTQIYTEYASGRQFRRGLYMGAWSPWRVVYDSLNKPSSDDVNAISRDTCHVAGFINGRKEAPYMRHTTSNEVVALLTTSAAAASYVSDIRMGANQSGAVWGSGGGTVSAGYVLTGGNFDDDRSWPIYAPVQKYINGQWYNVGRA